MLWCVFLLNFIIFQVLELCTLNKTFGLRQKQGASAFVSYKVLTDVNASSNLLTSGESVPTKLQRLFFAKGRYEIENEIAV